MTALFSNFDPDFASFLTRNASTDNPHYWPVARNFLLDERISLQRAESYRNHGAVAEHESMGKWIDGHNAYLEEEVFIPCDDSKPEPPENIHPEDPEVCPDTFRLPVLSSSLANTLTSDLIRVQKISSFEHALNESPETVLTLATGTLAKDQRASQELENLFQQFASVRNWQPVFAGIWEDLSDLFGEAPEGDSPGWADALRDRLGLYTYDPKQSGTPKKINPIHVLIFRYPIAAVPRLSSLGDRSRPLTVPCVLDGEFSHAFCPSPRESDTGHTMDLVGADSCDNLTREVLHPAMRLRAKHLFRVSSITRPIDPSAIREQRGLHLTYLRERFGRSEYGRHTDEDLL
uniref:Uncharacterized protein n=1 Tax=Candidatus Kentrum sp. LFY TaxID=2126342 RepID=A0A450UJW4_9GAMM|nr:MAG: hypothetical protein BECKLFY1418B_GA0070995_103919 [Candidatus Kentron sp. LFY]